MDLQSPHEQRKQIAAFLAQQRTGVINTIPSLPSRGIWAMPVWYRLYRKISHSQGFQVDCLVPRWADIAHQMKEGTEVLFIVQANSSAGLRWLQIQGTVQLVEAPDWDRLLPRWISTLQPDQLYLVVRLTPTRIDLVDEELGWGIQDTLEW